MYKPLRGLYIRLLKGKFDCNRMPGFPSAEDNIYEFSSSLNRYELKDVYRLQSDRFTPRALKWRNMEREIYYFDLYHGLKQTINNSGFDGPEEIHAAMVSSCSRMPGCYKWARKFLVN